MKMMHIHKWDNERLAIQVRSIAKDLNNECQVVLEEAIRRLSAGAGSGLVEPTGIELHKDAILERLRRPGYNYAGEADVQFRNDCADLIEHYAALSRPGMGYNE